MAEIKERKVILSIGCFNIGADEKGLYHISGPNYGKKCNLRFDAIELELHDYVVDNEFNICILFLYKGFLKKITFVDKNIVNIIKAILKKLGKRLRIPRKPGLVLKTRLDYTIEDLLELEVR